MSTEIQTREIEKKGAGLLALAEGLAIQTADDYTQAADYRGQAKAHIATVKAAFKESKQAADAAKRKLLDLEGKLLNPAEQVVEIVDGKMLEWSQEQDRIQREAQAKAEAAAQKQAEKEARKLEKKGLTEEAELARATPAPVIVESTVPSGVGVSVRTTWKGKVTDMKALVAAITAGQAPLNFLDINQSALDAYAKATDGQVSIPGFVAYRHASMAGTGR